MTDLMVTFEEVEVVAETFAALLVLIDDEEVWIPKSQIASGSVTEKDDEGKLIIPRWLAVSKGLL